MSSLSDEDIDGLANRLALLASGDGEADNAGRAVGALARRLGLTGGQLKAMFLEGARTGGTGTARLAVLSARVEQLESEAETMRDTLRKAEVAARALQRDRDSLRDEVEHLHGALGERRRSRRSRRAVMLAAAGAVALAVVLLIYGPRLSAGPERPDFVGGAAQFRIAVVRDRAIVLRRAPEPTAEALADLPVGTQLTVRRMLWHGLQQWVEVELNGQIGYVLSTDVDLS